ncbi:hypothetical protein K439DRAFT_293417 [Ramaria rubella]|nr:hypothetical protein K439DRAFT_293417 [Ramaria rubella]
MRWKSFVAPVIQPVSAMGSKAGALAFLLSIRRISLRLSITSPTSECMVYVISRFSILYNVMAGTTHFNTLLSTVVTVSIAHSSVKA